MPPLDTDPAIPTRVLARAKGPEVADWQSLAAIGPRLADVGPALSDAVGPDLAGICSAHHQHTVNLSQETDPNRGSSLDSSEESGQRGASFRGASLGIPDAAGQVAVPVGVRLATLEVDRHHFNNGGVGVPCDGRVYDGPNVIEQAQTPTALQRTAQTVQATILRDTITARRDRDTSRFHPINDGSIPVAQSSAHSARFREATAALNLQTISVVTLCHDDLRGYVTDEETCLKKYCPEGRQEPCQLIAFDKHLTKLLHLYDIPGGAGVGTVRASVHGVFFYYPVFIYLLYTRKEKTQRIAGYSI